MILTMKEKEEDVTKRRYVITNDKTCVPTYL